MPKPARQTGAITRAHADELLAFLPAFSTEDRPFVVRWRGLDPTPAGAVTMPYPEYCQDVFAFFRRAGLPPWPDHSYHPQRAAAMLADDAQVARATLSELRSMLTYCVRSERFGDGSWEALLKKGRVQALLRRLDTLRETLAP